MYTWHHRGNTGGQSSFPPGPPMRQISYVNVQSAPDRVEGGSEGTSCSNNAE